MRFFTIQLLVFLLNPSLSTSEETSEENLRATIVSALEKAIVFFNESYNDVNVDAVLGYRMLQAYLNATLEKWEPQPELQSTREDVAHLEKQLSTVIDKAENALEQNTPDYYRTFASALRPGFWKVPHQWIQTNSSLAPSPNDALGCLNESTSDSCISYLLGTWEDGSESCFVPGYCAGAMTELGCSGYSLSHQLFYFMFGEMKDCSDPLFLDAPYFKNVFCASMKQTNVDIEKQARLHTFGDLFVENILFCGVSGFSDFYKPRWLKLILNWQKPEKGCFRMYGDPFQSTSQTPGEHRQGLKRVKRQEKILKDGCSSHNTGVAVAALGGFLHYSF